GNTDPRRVYILQSVLVSNANPIPTGLQLAASTINTFESVGNLTITVNRSGDVSGSSTLDFTTSDGTATAGSDYTATSGTLTCAPGQSSRTITVPIIHDPLYEGVVETFNLSLSNPTRGALVGHTAAIISISDNDLQPTIQMASTFRATEGSAGTKVFNIPVNLS